MSQVLYNALWVDTLKYLERTLPRDRRAAAAKVEPNKELAHTAVTKLHVRYIDIIKHLEVCYDQLLHPQKRIVIRKLLDMCLGRCLELKHELVELDLSDFNYCDNAILEIKLVPMEVEMTIPNYFIREREVELARRKKTMAEIFKKIELEKAAMIAAAAAAAAADDVDAAVDTVDDDTAVEAGDEAAVEATDEATVDAAADAAVDANVDAAVDAADGAADGAAVDAADEAAVDETAEEEVIEATAGTSAEAAAEAAIDAALDAALEVAVDAAVEEAVDEDVEDASDDDDDDAPPAPAGMPLLEASLLLQRHERARQGRMKAVEQVRMNHIKALAAAGVKPTDEEEEKENEAAVMIQKTWKGYRVRRWVKHRQIQEGLLLGMYQPSWRSTEESRKFEDVRSYRHGLQKVNQLEYEQSLVDEKAKIMKRKGPWIMEDFCDEIRAWFIEWYQKTGRFPYPEYPDADDGGTALLIAGKVMTPEQYIKMQIAIAKEKAKPKAQQLKEKADREKKKAKEKALALKAAETARKKAEAEKNKPSEGFKLKPSKFFKPLAETVKVYNTVWKNRPDQDNPQQKHHVDMIIVDKQREVEVELRVVVDMIMCVEMDHLEAALERDILKKKKGKKGKKQKKKKKKKKSKRGKKKKDPTAHRTTEDIFEELFTNGIIRKYPEEKLSNFIGEFSYNNYDRRKMFQNPLPCLGDIRQVILEYCILPMGSPTVHQLAPLVRSMCLCGPRGSGKHLLANAICTELGAVMFDLTPSNVVGKYPGKAGLKMLFHLVEKMSRILQPSIIYTDGAEKHFYKKVPKPERKTEPRRIGKVLPKLAKGITPQDQVMLLGISKQPWASKPRKFVKTYQKMILLPWADYGTLYHVWRNQLMQHHGVSRDLDVSSIARLSTGYPIGTIRDLVASMMTTRRIIRLKNDPLTPREILETLFTVKPVTKKEMDKYIKWFATKTVLGRKKAKIMKAEALLREEERKRKEAEEKNQNRRR